LNFSYSDLAGASFTRFSGSARHALFVFKRDLMSLHIFNVGARGLKLHSGYCKITRLHFAQVFKDENAEPIAAKTFHFLQFEILQNFLAEFSITLPDGFLDALATDYLDENCSERLMFWDKGGAMFEEPCRVIH
jgi:hypothetical protein